jgi:tRNA(Ile)-lysidine synthase
MIAGLFDDLPVVTAHTREDQAETVAMRILRGASARGLAGMAYPTPGIVRPFLGISRSLIAAWAADFDVPFIEDPTNASPRFLRNRLRGDLLPAVARARPDFVDALVAIGDRAAAWRSQLATLVDALGVQVGTAVVVPAEALRGMDRASLGIVWPELAGRAGVSMDHRGVARAAAWTPTARAGQRIPLSGGIEIVRTRTAFAVRRADG